MLKSVLVTLFLAPSAIVSGVEIHQTQVQLPKAESRRLNIFDSITGLVDQRQGDIQVSIENEHDTFSAENDKTVNAILQDSLVDLTDFLRTLEIDDPSKAMRIPVRVVLVQSSLTVFQSLFKMLSNPKESRSPTPWQQYLRESINNQQCSVKDLCDEFHQNFKCDEEGRLGAIMLDYRHPFDHLNLLMIPNTVKILFLRRTKLKTISEWTDLKGKSLKRLYLDKNYGLKLNFDGLSRELNHLPLKHMSVSTRPIINYFGEENWWRACPQIGNWMKTSMLTSLQIRGTLKGTPYCGVVFACDGSLIFDH